MIWGFTGTRTGMSGPQATELLVELTSPFTYVAPEEIAYLEIAYFHHGDCVGSDYLAACMADKVGWITVAHPPLNDKYRAHHASNIILDKDTYLGRDEAIVRAAEKMIATPRNYYPVARSGTWATIRYAQKIGKPVLIIFPDGRKELR